MDLDFRCGGSWIEQEPTAFYIEERTSVLADLGSTPLLPQPNPMAALLRAGPCRWRPARDRVDARPGPGARHAARGWCGVGSGVANLEECKTPLEEKGDRKLGNGDIL